MRRSFLFVLMWAAGVMLGSGAAETPGFDPTTSYEKTTLRGWTVYVNRKLVAETILARDVLSLLEMRLAEAERVLPAKAVSMLRDRVPIWMELTSRKFPGGCYHPSKKWLTENGFNPDKAESVEFGNAANFLSWQRAQPAMVIHELSHAYHHLVLSHGNTLIKAAFEQAKESRSYESVLYVAGERKKAYAMNNEQEYFAETSEAYFSTNDFYPFVKAELKEHDPLMFTTVERVWGVGAR